MFYDITKVLNYGEKFKCNWYMLCGNREIGKSTRIFRYILHKFLKREVENYRLQKHNKEIKNHRKTIILTRYDTDIPKLTTKWISLFDNIQKIWYKNCNIKYNKATKSFFIHNKEFAIVVGLSAVSKLRSSVLSDYEYIVFDEFINIDNKFIHTKDDPYKEINLLIDFYQTVARENNNLFKDVKVFLMSNNVKISNEYFVYFGLDKMINRKQNFYHKNNICLEISKIKIEKYKDSRLFQMTKDLDYGKFAFENDFFIKGNELIKKMKKNNPKISLIYCNKNITLYQDKCLYIALSKKPYNKYITVEDKDRQTDIMHIDEFKKTDFYKNFVSMFNNGKVFFENQTAQDLFLKILQY